MKLTFSTDRIRHASILNEDGHIVYRVVTPVDPKRPSTSRIYKARKLRSRASQSSLLDVNSQSSAHSSLSSLDESPVSPQATRSHRGRKVPTEDELSEIGFEPLAEIEWHSVRPCQFAWLGGPVAGALDTGRCDSQTFIPTCDFWKRERSFPAPDGNTYHWKTGSQSVLYRDDDRSDRPHPVAEYHPKRDSDHGFLEIDLPKLLGRLGPSHSPSSTTITDVAISETPAPSSTNASMKRAKADETLVDLVVFTFIYVEKLRRNRDLAKAEDDV